MNGDWTHGTYATYAHGCRCRGCTDAQAAYQRRRRARQEAAS